MPRGDLELPVIITSKFLDYVNHAEGTLKFTYIDYVIYTFFLHTEK